MVNNLGIMSSWIRKNSKIHVAPSHFSPDFAKAKLSHCNIIAFTMQYHSFHNAISQLLPPNIIAFEKQIFRIFILNPVC